MLRWCEEAYGIKWAAPRYFNAAGAHVSGSIDEDHDPELHLVPIVLQAALGKIVALQDIQSSDLVGCTPPHGRRQ